MLTIDRYIFSEWFKTFFIAIGVTLGILLLEDVYSNLEDLLEYGASLGDILRYYVILIPSLLPTVLPISLLLSILLSLGGLHKNNEIVALRACGLGIMRITRSLWIVGIVLTGALFYLNADLVPRSLESSRRIIQNYEFKGEVAKTGSEDVGLIYNLTFRNHSEGTMWFMNRFSEKSFRAFGITVSIFNEEGKEARRILATTGYYSDYDKHWVFQNGRDMYFDPDSEEVRRAPSFVEMEVAELKDPPTLMLMLKKRPKDLSLLEVNSILRSLPEEGDPRVNGFQVRYFSILTNPFTCLVVVALAIPFAVTGVRVNPVVGVTKSIGLFFVFYIITSICNMLGSSQVLTPLTAALIPLGLTLLFTVFLYRKMV